MKRRGICLVRFDDILGPMSIYSKNINEQYLQKIATKSHLSTLSLTSESDIVEKDFFNSIIPFPDEELIAYSTYFFKKDENVRGGYQTFGIIILTDLAQQMYLFKSIPKITANVQKTAMIIKNEENNRKFLTKEIKNHLDKLIEIENLQVEFSDETGSLELQKNRQDNNEYLNQSSINLEANSEYQIGSFSFLYQKMPASIDKIINSILSNETILIIGRQDEILITLNTLKEFLPHKKTYSDPWLAPIADADVLYSKTTEKFLLHLLGIREESLYREVDYDEKERMKQVLRHSTVDFSDFLKNFPITSKVVIDFYQGVVYGGTTNKYCSYINESIKDSDFNEAKEIINDKIYYLIDRSNKLRDILYVDKDQEINFSQFLSNCMDGELPILMNLISDMNPKLLQKITTFISHSNFMINDYS